ncbi:vesicle transport protein USE1 isoform X1 [Schistocerca nitens]|uniref:vesicle transport protein USE1 isoform X1 n=2 Tax=Schistocerca nitens TaxID=7011 RepID=UPI002117820E|nr:vesicle transport protein USE1 isoform X1 [Schistocerca nitens]
MQKLRALSVKTASVIGSMGMSKLEVNLQRLLLHCDELAREDKKDWRLDKYILALDEMISSLQKLPNKPNKDTMADYVRRVVFLKGIAETNKLNNPVEKVVAAQLLPHGTATASETIIKEIHQKTTSKYNKELREQLLQTEKGTDSDIRQRKPKTSGKDLDDLLKLHHSMQEKIAEDMISLARNLKQQSQVASSIINKDNEVLSKSSTQTDKNITRLKAESERLQEYSRRAWKCWLWLMVAVAVMIFFGMLLFIRVTKK